MICNFYHINYAHNEENGKPKPKAKVVIVIIVGVHDWKVILCDVVASSWGNRANEKDTKFKKVSSTSCINIINHCDNENKGKSINNLESR